MSQPQIHDRVAHLEHRLARVERAQKGSWDWLSVPFETDEDKARVAGWGLVALALVSLTTFTLNSALITLLFSAVLLIGIILVFSASGLIGASDSYRELASHQRASKATHARHLHGHPRAKTASFKLQNWHVVGVAAVFILAAIGGWMLTSYVSGPVMEAYIVGGMLLVWGVTGIYTDRKVPAYGSMIAIGLLSIAFPYPFALLIGALTSLTVLWLVAREKRWAKPQIAGGVLMATAFLSYILNPESFTEVSTAMLLIATFFGLVLLALPYAQMERTLEDRNSSRILLLLAPLVTVYIMTVAGPFNSLDGLFVSLVLISVGYSGLAFISWLQYGRLSYAKYFATVALGFLFTLVYLYLDPTTVMLMSLVAAIGLLAGGFILPSYSMRLVGLGTLAGSVLYYFMTVYGQEPVAGVFYLQDRVWLGLLVAAFLPALALWYQRAPLTPSERKLEPVVVSSLGVSSFLILFSLTVTDFASSVQTMAWLLIGALAFWYGKRANSRPLELGALIILALAVIKMYLVDFTSFNLGLQIVVFFLTLLVLLIIRATLPLRRWWRAQN